MPRLRMRLFPAPENHMKTAAHLVQTIGFLPWAALPFQPKAQPGKPDPPELLALPDPLDPPSPNQTFPIG